ncbi:MAG: hypothetical protein KA712_14390 [Myxococcales bacterium]|nr:hypothetical protein [Myxococcales bacterium]
MATDILKYVFIAAGLVGFVSAVKKWRLRRWQMQRLRGHGARKGGPPEATARGAPPAPPPDVTGQKAP